jgi:hypothetical protein
VKSEETGYIEGVEPAFVLIYHSSFVPSTKYAGTTLILAKQSSFKLSSLAMKVCGSSTIGGLGVNVIENSYNPSKMANVVV